MKVLFVSNFLNHHQTFLCEELMKQCDEFIFVATHDVANVGFQIAEEKPYVAHYYNDNEKAEIERNIVEADVVIFGACPNHLIALRMQKNKLSFLFSERFFKKGTWRRFIPRTRKTVLDRVAQYKDKNLYVLCASAYLPYDLSLMGFPVEKCLRWGYFPEQIAYNEDVVLAEKQPNSLLWCGRFLAWKNPETAVRLAQRLKKDGYAFTLTMVGGGEKETAVRRQVQRAGLEDYVRLVGSKTAKEVREYMKDAQIFLATSNKREGWGAVINEAMNGACAVVASKHMGSSPFLIQDEQNGRIFSLNNERALYRKVKELLDNPQMRICLGKKAYQTIENEWNAKIAAERLMTFARAYLVGEQLTFESGVCSKAQIMKD